MTGVDRMRRSLLRGVAGTVAALAPAWKQPIVSAAEPAGDEAALSTNFALVTLGDAALAARAIRTVDMGEVVVSSGRLRACDPFAYPDFPPLARAVAPGRYPVRLYYAFGRVAAASMRLTAQAPRSWEPAAFVKDDSWKAAVFSDSYPVDAGIGSYMDADTLAQMKRRKDQVRGKRAATEVNYYDDVVAGELAANEHDWALHRPMPDSPLNVAMFDSGWGDGFYPVYWGLAENGAPAVLLTDFHGMEQADGRKEPRQ